MQTFLTIIAAAVLLYNFRWNIIETLDEDITITKEEAQNRFIPDVARWYGEATLAAQEHDVPVDILLSIIDQESDGEKGRGMHPDGESWGLVGLTQIAAEEIGIQDRKDLVPREQINAAAEYLAHTLEVQTYDEDKIYHALRGYNGGPERADGDPTVSDQYAKEVMERAGREVPNQ